MTLIIHWWMFPMAMVLAALMLMVIADRKSGMFGGMFETLAALGMLVGAVMSIIVRLWP